MKQSNEKKYMTFKPEFRKFEKTKREDFDKYFSTKYIGCYTKHAIKIAKPCSRCAYFLRQYAEASFFQHV